MGHPLTLVSRHLQQHHTSISHSESPQSSPTPQSSQNLVPGDTIPHPPQRRRRQYGMSTGDRGYYTSHRERPTGLGHPLPPVSDYLQWHTSTPSSGSSHSSHTLQGSQNPLPSTNSPPLPDGEGSQNEESPNEAAQSTSQSQNSPGFDFSLYFVPDNHPLQFVSPANLVDSAYLQRIPHTPPDALQPASKRLRIDENLPLDYFKLPDLWGSHTPVWRGFLEKGYYTSSEVPQYGPNGFHPVIREELNAYLSKAKMLESQGRVDNCVHSLVQQALAQNPIIYLTALAAMGTKNHRLISLPVRLIRFSRSGPSIFMDPGFPFEKYTDLLGEVRGVPATSLFYSLDGARLRVATGIRYKKDVGALWDKCGGDLAVVGSQLSEEDLSIVELSGGEFITMPPQVIWCCESQGNTQPPDTASRTPSSYPITLVEVRYISVKPEGEIDFDYWQEGSYDKISRFNRDLLTPAVNGWGGEAVQEETKFKAAIEMRGVWAIGDALLGLTSWDSARVQLELHDLFDAPPGHCFNPKFVDFIQDQLDSKLEDMAETYHLVHTRLFPSQLTD